MQNLDSGVVAAKNSFLLTVGRFTLRQRWNAYTCGLDQLEGSEVAHPYAPLLLAA
jgi:hypothetical protein